jgi:hypothetical protein
LKKRIHFRVLGCQRIKCCPDKSWMKTRLLITCIEFVDIHLFSRPLRSALGWHLVARRLVRRLSVLKGSSVATRLNNRVFSLLQQLHTLKKQQYEHSLYLKQQAVVGKPQGNSSKPCNSPTLQLANSQHKKSLRLFITPVFPVCFDSWFVSKSWRLRNRCCLNEVSSSISSHDESTNRIKTTGCLFFCFVFFGQAKKMKRKKQVGR